MALSNIFKEPRREIIETIIGLAVVIPLSYADYCAAVWAQSVTGGDYRGIPWQLGMPVGLVAVIFIIVALLIVAIAIHAIG